MFPKLVCKNRRVQSRTSGNSNSGKMNAHDREDECGVKRPGEREVLLVYVGHRDVSLGLLQGLGRELWIGTIQIFRSRRHRWRTVCTLTLENSREKAFGSATATFVLSSRAGMLTVDVGLDGSLLLDVGVLLSDPGPRESPRDGWTGLLTLRLWAALYAERFSRSQYTDTL